MPTEARSSVGLLAVACLAFAPLLYAGPPAQIKQDLPKPAAKSLPPVNLLAIIERTGGYAGFYDRFEISQDGKVSNSEGKTMQIAVQELAAIRRRIGTLDVPGSRRIDYMHELCSDCFHYRITLMGSNGAIVLELLEPQLGGPDSVSKLARDLRDLVVSLKWK